MHLVWKVRPDIKEVRDKRFPSELVQPPELKILPSGHFRFALLFFDAETDALLGTIEGFRITRDLSSILPPASRGIKSEIYHFVNFTPEWLGLIRDRFKLCIEALRKKNQEDGWIQYQPQFQNHPQPD